MKLKHTQKKSPLRWLTHTMTLFSLGLFAILSLGLTLFYNYCNTDILLYTSVLPEILKVLIDLLEVGIYAICFSLLLFSAFFRHENAPSLSLLFIYIGGVTFRRVCDLVGVLILYGSLDSLDLTYAVVYILLDTALAIAVFFLSRGGANRYYRAQANALRADTLFGDGEVQLSTQSLHPFRSIVDKKNLIQARVLTVSIILAGIKVLSRLVYDIDYGAPADAKEFLIMTVYYLSDLLLAVAFYVLSILVLNKLFKHKQKKDEVN